MKYCMHCSKAEVQNLFALCDECNDKYRRYIESLGAEVVGEPKMSIKDGQMNVQINLKLSQPLKYVAFTLDEISAKEMGLKVLESAEQVLKEALEETEDE